MTAVMVLVRTVNRIKTLQKAVAHIGSNIEILTYIDYKKNKSNEKNFF